MIVDPEPSEGLKTVATYADKYGFSAVKDDLDFAAGFVAGQIVAEAIALTGPEPMREKLVATMLKGFDVDTTELTGPISTPRTITAGWSCSGPTPATSRRSGSCPSARTPTARST